jgi:hypothetical protein
LAADGAGVEHELVFVRHRSEVWEATIVVECAEFTHRTIPFPVAAG